MTRARASLLAIALLATSFSPEASAVPSPLDTTPVVGAAPVFQAPVPVVYTLSNGLAVWVVERPSLPLVSVHVVVKGGSAADPDQRPGLAALTDTMLTHGAADRDATAFAAAVEQQAIRLEVSTDASYSEVGLATHADRLDLALDLMADAILRPRFDADELARVKAQRDSELAESLDDPMQVAKNVTSRAYYGAGHPYAHPTMGTRAGVAAATLDDVRASWAARFGANRATITVVGAVTGPQIRDALEKRLGAWAASAPAPVIAPAPARKKQSFVLVDNPGSSQSVIYVMMPAPGPGQPELHAARMGVIALGGTFTSRLNNLLREEKGYTYGVAARLAPDRDNTTVFVRTAVRQDVTAPALKDLLGELNRLPKGISAEELDKARGARRSTLVDALESRSGAASAIAGLQALGLPPDNWQNELVVLGGLDPKAVKSALKRVGLKQAVVVVVGDASVIQPELAKAVKGPWITAARDQ